MIFSALFILGIIHTVQFYFILFYPFSLPNFNLVSLLQLPNRLGRRWLKSCVPRNMTRQTALLNTRPLNQSHQCVGGNTVHLTTEVSLQARYKQSIERDEQSKAPPS